MAYDEISLLPDTPLLGQSPYEEVDISPMDDFREVLAEKTPENDEIAILQEEQPDEEITPEIVEQNKTQKKIDDIFPPETGPAFELLPVEKREPYYRNIPYLEKGDVPGLLELDEIWTADRTGRSPAGLQDDIKENFLKAKELFERGKDVLIDAYQSTAESQRLGADALQATRDRAEGKITKETYNLVRQGLAEESQKIEELRKDLKDLGMPEYVLKSVGDLLPSQLEIVKETIKGGLKGYGVKKIAGMILGFIPHPLAKIGGKVLEYAPMAGRVSHGYRAGYELEAGGIAFDLMLHKDKNGKQLSAEEVQFYARWGGAFAGALEYVGGATIAAGGGIGKLATGPMKAKATAAITKIATNPVLRNRLTSLLGGVSLSVAGEVVTENAQEITTSVAIKMAKNPKANMEDVFFEVLEEHKGKFEELSKTTATGTAAITLALRGLTGGARGSHARTVGKKLQQKNEAEADALLKVEGARQDRDTLERAVKVTEKIPLAKKRPEKLREFIGEQADAHVSAQEVKEYYDEQGLDVRDEIRKGLGENVAEEFETALETGEPVRVDALDMVEFLADNKDTALKDAFLGNTKLDPEGITQTEAKLLSEEILKEEEDALKLREEVEVEADKEEGPPSVPAEVKPPEVEQGEKLEAEPPTVPPVAPEKLPDLPAREPPKIESPQELRKIEAQIEHEVLMRVFKELREEVVYTEKADQLKEGVGLGSYQKILESKEFQEETALRQGDRQAANDFSKVVAGIYSSLAQKAGIPLKDFYAENRIDFRFNPENLNTLGEFHWSRANGERVTIEIGTPTAIHAKLVGAEIGEGVTGTLIHEMGHWVLEIMLKYRSNPQLQKDSQAIFDWLKIDPEEFLNLESSDPKFQAKHEAMAEAFQQYFIEGKAPTKKLQSVFQRFSQFMLDIYKLITGIRELNGNRSDPNVKLNDDIRRVFDRLLVAEQEFISLSHEYTPNTFYELLTQSGFTEKQARFYMEARENARQEILGKFLEKEIKKEKRRRTKERKQLIEDAGNEWLTNVANNIKAYRVVSNLTRGTLPDGTGLPDNLKAKLDKEAFFELLTPAERNLFESSGEKPYVEKGGVDPTVFANSYGYSSFADMLADIDKFPPLDAAKEMAGEVAANERFPDPFNAEEIERVAQDAVTDDVRLKLALWEQELLAQRHFKKTEKKVAIAGMTNHPRTQAIRQAAREAVNKRTLREISNGRIYDAAAKKWQREKVRAFKKGDTQAMLDANKRQTYNLALYSEARKMVKNKEAIDRRAKRLQATKLTKDLNKAGSPLAQEIPEVLNNYTFGKSPRRADRGLPDAEKHIENLTGEQLEQLAIELTELYQAARMVINEDTEAYKKEYQARVDSLLTTVEGAKKGRPSGKFKTWYEMLLLKPETILILMDQGKNLGKWWKEIYRPIENAHDGYLESSRRVKKSFEDRLNKHYSKKEQGRLPLKTINAGGKSWSKQEALSILMNYGNAGGRNRLENMGIDEIVAMEIFRQLDDRDFQYAQETVDDINSYWESIKTLELETKGTAPKQVEALPFEVGGRKVKGGYYPIQYDGDELVERVSAKGLSPDELTSGADHRGVYAQTRDGFTKKRVEDFDVPLALELSVPLRHLDEVVYTLNFRKSVLAVGKFLRNPKIKKALNDGAGDGAWDTMATWLKSISKNSTIDVTAGASNKVIGGLESLLRKGRRNTSLALMGASIRTAVVQPLGLIPSANRLGIIRVLGKATVSGIRPFNFSKKLKHMKALSPYMRERANLFERDAYEYLDKQTGGGVLGKIQDSHSWWTRNAFKFMAGADLATSGVTWMAAFDAASAGKIEGVDGSNLDDVVRYADQAVRLTQGSGGRKDQATITAYNELTKAITMFMSYFNAVFNEKTLTSREFRAGRVGYGQLAKMYLLLFVMPGILEEAILGDSSEDEDENDAMERYATAVLASYLGMFPIVREIPSAIKGFKIAGSPLVSQGQNLVKGPLNLAKKFLDEDKEFSITRSDRVNLINGLGLVGGLPSSQLNRTIDGLHLLAEEQIDLVDFVRVLSKGATRQEKREIQGR